MATTEDYHGSSTAQDPSTIATRSSGKAADSTEPNSNTQLMSSSSAVITTNRSIPASSDSRRPLRPIQDILARLTWDTEHSSTTTSTSATSATNTDKSDALSSTVSKSIYIVGYEDRFRADIQEKPLSAWQRETTSDEFIPLHRIRYVKLRKLRDDSSNSAPKLSATTGGGRSKRNRNMTDAEMEAEAKADVLEAKATIRGFEERMRTTASTEVRRSLEDIVEKLREQYGFDDEVDESSGVTSEEQQNARDDGLEEKDVILWDRDARIDRVFGSGNVNEQV